jgi:hypothetical protein
MATNNQVDTVVMSGGAPMSPLMAGFLFALWERGKTFRNFHTSGAGALMALLSLAPRKGTPGDALQGWVESGVADEIYRPFPVNFKLFRKPGPFTPAVQRLAQRYKLPLTGKTPPTDDKVPIRDLIAATRAKKGERDPIRELLAEWIARPAHDNPSAADLKRRKANPSEQLHAALLNLWRKDAAGGLYETLMNRKDPVKMFRDKWLEAIFRTDSQRRVYNDLVDLSLAAVTPSTLTSKSDGLAAPLPFLEELVNFEVLDRKMRAIAGRGHFCVNAYNMSADIDEKRAKFFEERARRDEEDLELMSAITELGSAAAKRPRPLVRPEVAHIKQRKEERRVAIRRAMELFESPKPRSQKKPLGADHIRAAFSMPFIYPPAELDGNYYSEGADHQPLNFFHVEDLDDDCTVVLLDVLADLEDYLVRRPRDLWDAYVISIMTPVVALARAAIDEFEERQDDRSTSNKDARKLSPAERRLYRRKGVVTLDKIHWNLNSEVQPFIMDWSYSNLKTLFDVGKEAGREFYSWVTNEGSTRRRLVDHPNPPRRIIR